ncbi:hypothetical protein AB0C59_25400 [Streptomyces sp. NPDC048664]|uniref:hypothetical protein n=1 Tax=Streptomyces sp. NPDC048664 TaxID=3154505 RepID=UPI00343773C1
MVNGRTVLERFPAGGPRGSWPAEEFARARRLEGQPAEVVMDLATDAFLVVVQGVEAADRYPGGKLATASRIDRFPGTRPGADRSGTERA